MPKERIINLMQEVDLSVFFFMESVKTCFDLVGAKIILDDRLNDGNWGLHHENGCIDFIKDALDTTFYRLRHRIKDDIRRYEMAAKEA